MSPGDRDQQIAATITTRGAVYGIAWERREVAAALAAAREEARAEEAARWQAKIEAAVQAVRELVSVPPEPGHSTLWLQGRMTVVTALRAAVAALDPKEQDR